jgi:hypothetical protein
VCRSKHVEPSVNFGIINSITKLHLVGISTESSTLHGSINMKFMNNALFRNETGVPSGFAQEQFDFATERSHKQEIVI